MPVRIPVYEALTFEREMVGGRNRPWLVSVQTGRGMELFVAKFFAHQDIEQQNALCREVYASVLASELGLRTPNFALITVDNPFKDTLTEEKRKELEQKHIRFGFGSKFIGGAYQFSPAQHTKELAGYDIASIFLLMY